MTATQTEVIGMLENERGLIRQERAALKAAGVDADKFDAELAAIEKRLVEANADQERAKRVLRESTVVVETVFVEGYRRGSSILDALIGAVGKTTPAGKNFQRLRSRIRLPGEQPEDVTTPGETPHDAPQ